MSDWPRLPLGEIFEIARGGSPRPIDDYITDAEDGINWISIADASDSAKYIERTKRRIRPEGASRSRAVFPGDLLLTNSMSFGRPYIMRTTGCIHDGWLVLANKREGIDQDFFYRLLGSDAVYASFAKLAAGATVKNLNIELVKGVEVPVPPLPEQRRIAAILDQADALRAKRREALTQLDSLTQSIFIEMFGDPAKNPKGWPLVALSKLIREDDSINYGVVQPGDALDEGVPLVRVGDLVDGEFSGATLKRIDPEIESAYKRSRLRGDEVLVSCVGSVGVTVLATPAMKGFNIARDVARIPLAEAINRTFVASYLKTDAVQNYFKGELRTVAQPTLNIKQIAETKVYSPPLALQESFASRIQAVEALKTTHKTALSEADALCASLQHRAFAGQLL